MNEEIKKLADLITLINKLPSPKKNAVLDLIEEVNAERIDLQDTEKVDKFLTDRIESYKKADTTVSITML